MLISTKPDTPGKEAVLYRSRQLTEFTWTPLGDIPVFTKETGKTVLPAGSPQRGMLYSSTEPTDKFITENISFETFLSIVANPHSALYHKDLNGHNNSWAYFGIVCNGLARYSFHIRRRFSTKRWPTVPGMYKIADEGKYSAEDMRLCDVLYAYGKGRNHVALITDLLRDEENVIREIEVSEAIRPTCVRVRYPVEVFFEKYALFALWRYAYVDSVPMPDPQQDTILKKGVPGLPGIAVDYGNKTNYRDYEDIVISAFVPGTVRLFREDSCIETISFPVSGKTVRKLPRGYYRLVHEEAGETAEFCVTAPKLSFSVSDGCLTVQADPCDGNSRIVYMEFRELSRAQRKAATGKDHENTEVAYYSNDCAALAKVEELTEEEKRTGLFTRPIPEDGANFKVYFENKYGFWTHTMIDFR